MNERTNTGEIIGPSGETCGANDSIYWWKFTTYRKSTHNQSLRILYLSVQPTGEEIQKYLENCPLLRRFKIDLK